MRLQGVRRTSAVLLVTALAAGTCTTAWASSAGASVRPERSDGHGTDDGRSHRPDIGTAVTMVRNADGSVTIVSQ
jgi:hypothetical protein